MSGFLGRIKSKVVALVEAAAAEGPKPRTGAGKKPVVRQPAAVAKRPLPASSSSADLPHQHKVVVGPAGPVAPTIRAAGPSLVDEYSWMKHASQSRRLSDVMNALVAAERTHLLRACAEWAPLQRTLVGELTALATVPVDHGAQGPGPQGLQDLTPAERLGDYLYYSGRPAGADSVVYYRRRAPLGADGTAAPAGAGPEEVLLDQNHVTHELGIKDCVYLMMGQMKVSADQTLLAFTLDTAGDEVYTLYFRDLTTGQLLREETVPNVLSVVFAEAPGAPPGQPRILFYTQADSLRRACRVYRRVMGTPVSDDVLVHEEPDGRWFVDVTVSKDGQLVTINSNDRVSSEVRLVGCSAPLDPPTLVHPRQEGVQYFVEHNNGSVFIITNAGGADNYKVVRAPVDAPHQGNWHEVVPPSSARKIEDMDMFKDHAVLYSRDEGIASAQVVSVAPPHTLSCVAFPPGTIDLFPGANQDFHAASARIGAASGVAPEVEFDCDLATQALHKVFQAPVGHRAGHPPFNPDAYECFREWFPSGDGVRVPTTIVQRKDRKRDGRSPLLLNAYGAYGQNLDAAFKPSRLCLLDRGWAIAYAHVRGGGELGTRWYQDGKLLSKGNTFEDFVSVAMGLLERGYSVPHLMAAKGVSAGGLVCGYAANYCPELFRAMVMKVPFVDVLGAMEDPDLPLTQQEYLEWGNPAVPAYQSLMASYCPYTNVAKGCVPPSILLSCGLNDPRVPAWQCLRYLSRLRHRMDQEAARHGGVAIVAVVDDDAGHFGAAGTSAQIDAQAREYAFLLHHVTHSR